MMRMQEDRLSHFYRNRLYRSLVFFYLLLVYSEKYTTFASLFGIQNILP